MRVYDWHNSRGKPKKINKKAYLERYAFTGIGKNDNIRMKIEYRSELYDCTENEETEI